MYDNNYLSKIDFCFCRHQHCAKKNNMASIYNDMNSSLDEKRAVVVVYLDSTVPL